MPDAPARLHSAAIKLAVRTNRSAYPMTVTTLLIKQREVGKKASPVVLNDSNVL